MFILISGCINSSSNQFSNIDQNETVSIPRLDDGRLFIELTSNRKVDISVYLKKHQNIQNITVRNDSGTSVHQEDGEPFSKVFNISDDGERVHIIIKTKNGKTFRYARS
jgi:hypothetical protein